MNIKYNNVRKTYYDLGLFYSLEIKSLEKKSGLFQDTALSSYTKIREKTKWIETKITERHTRISDF